MARQPRLRLPNHVGGICVIVPQMEQFPVLSRIIGYSVAFVLITLLPFGWYCALIGAGFLLIAYWQYKDGDLVILPHRREKRGYQAATLVTPLPNPQHKGGQSFHAREETPGRRR